MNEPEGAIFQLSARMFEASRGLTDAMFYAGNLGEKARDIYNNLLNAHDLVATAFIGLNELEEEEGEDE